MEDEKTFLPNGVGHGDDTLHFYSVGEKLFPLVQLHQAVWDDMPCWTNPFCLGEEEETRSCQFCRWTYHLKCSGFRCNHCDCVDLPKVVKRLQVLVDDFSTLLNRCYSDSDRFKVTVRHHMDHSPIMKQRRSYNNWFLETLDEEKVGIYSILSGFPSGKTT